jgi:hypothetical protein
VDVHERVTDRDAVAARDQGERVGRREQPLVQRSPPRPGLGAVDRGQPGRPDRPVVVEQREPERLDLGDQLRPAPRERDTQRRRPALEPAQPSSRVGSMRP